MLTADELEAMQATSASALPASCTVTRQASEGTFDAETGRYVDPAPETVWAGACRVRSLLQQAADATVGDLREAPGRYQVTLPAEAEGVRVDDFVTVTDTTDPDLVGRSLRVLDTRWSEPFIDRRLVCEDLQTVHTED